MVRSKRVKRKYQRKISMKKRKKRISTKRSRRTLKKSRKTLKSRRCLKSRIRYKKTTRKVKTIKGGNPLSLGTPEFMKQVNDTKDAGVRNNFKSVMTSLKWLTDEKVNHCMNCNTVFGFFTRRHHCRNCGGIFCLTCSTYKKEFSDGKEYRVCEFCYDRVAKDNPEKENPEKENPENPEKVIPEINITITTSDLMGNTNKYTVSNYITIEELKGMNTNGIPVDEQRLIYDNQDLRDSVPLYRLGIVNGTTLHLALKAGEAARVEAARVEAEEEKGEQVSSRVEVLDEPMTEVLVEEPVSILILGRTIEEQLMHKMPDSNFTALLNNLELQGKNVTIYLLDKKVSSTESITLEGITCVQITDDFNNFFDKEGPQYDFILNDTKTIRFITGEFGKKTDDYKGTKILKKLKTEGQCLLQEIMDTYAKSNLSPYSARPSTIDIVTSKCFDSVDSVDSVEGEKIIGTYPLECNPLLTWTSEEHGSDNFPLSYYYRWQKD